MTVQCLGSVVSIKRELPPSHSRFRRAAMLQQRTADAATIRSMDYYKFTLVNGFGQTSEESMYLRETVAQVTGITLIYWAEY